jgi:AcrR family transcriptional regulator
MSQAGEIRQPQQRRSQEAFDRVLKAGREILESEGVEGFTVAAVSKRAGVSIGSIYLRAPSRDALLLAIHDEEMHRLESEEVALHIVDKLEVDARTHVIDLVVKTAGHTLANAGILRAFMRRGPDDPEIWARAQATSQRIAAEFEVAMLTRRDAFRHPDPEKAVDFAFRMVYNMTARRVTHGPDFESARPLTDEEFLEELGQAVADYLVG